MGKWSRGAWLGPLAARLSSRTLTALVAVLFAVDVIVPDPIPFADELLLGLATVLLSRRRERAR